MKTTSPGILGAAVALALGLALSGGRLEAQIGPGLGWAARVFATAEAEAEATLAAQAKLRAELDAEIEATCQRIAGKLASVSLAECLDSQLEHTGARSVLGTPILAREYPPLDTREPLGRVLLFGGIHGDEYSSVSVVFKWLQVLNHYHSGMFHWRVVPLLNPDGLLRKPAQRMNENGVDLNRNFPSPNWHEETEDYWVRRTARNPRRYPGPAPLSEPEARWLAEEIERFDPAVIVSVHAPISVVDFDGPKTPPGQLGPLYLDRMGTYPGSLGRYAGVHMNLPVVTIELPSAGIMPTPAQQNRIWTDLVAWLKREAPGRAASPATAIASGGAR